KIARMPYSLSKGPDARSLALSATPSNLVVLTATIDDTDNGGQDIAAAQCCIAVPFWQTGCVAFAMSPADGSFNSRVELVRAFIPEAMLTNGAPLVFVRGRDALANWGPVSAVLADEIPEPRLLLALMAMAMGMRMAGMRRTGKA
ncbi:hypothetical protein GX586_02060, partial [bacterium]|nr:hypothetical protein [bacterium]